MGIAVLAPISASFISASTGWLLATPPCADAIHPCVTLLVRKTTDGGQSWFQVYSSAAGSTAWRPVPGAAGTHVSPASLVVAGQAGYVFATTGLGRPVLLTGPVSGLDRWQPLRNPCRSAWSMAVAAAPGGWLFLGCGYDPSAGNQVKTAYVSGNGGRVWRQVATPPTGGYLTAASMTAGGTIFLSGSRMNVYISRNRGHNWHTSPSLNDASDSAAPASPCGPRRLPRPADSPSRRAPTTTRYGSPVIAAATGLRLPSTDPAAASQPGASQAGPGRRAAPTIMGRSILGALTTSPLRTDSRVSGDALISRSVSRLGWQPISG